jgi:hypothetical protein
MGGWQHVRSSCALQGGQQGRNSRTHRLTERHRPPPPRQRRTPLRRRHFHQVDPIPLRLGQPPPPRRQRLGRAGRLDVNDGAAGPKWDHGRARVPHQTSGAAVPLPFTLPSQAILKGSSKKSSPLLHAVSHIPRQQACSAGLLRLAIPQSDGRRQQACRLWRITYASGPLPRPVDH